MAAADLIIAVPEHRPWPSARARGVTLTLLTATYFSSYVDRQILAVLQEQNKRDLALSDTQLGLVSGLVFAAFYATLAVPVARIANRTSQRDVVAITMRAMWAAIALLGVNLVGLGLGPLMVGRISDLLRPELGAQSLRYAMLVMALCTPWPIFHYWRAGVLMRRTGPAGAAG